MFTNWKTSVTGVIVLLGVLWNAWQTKTISWPDLQGALVALGLIVAKDFSVTGTTKL